MRPDALSEDVALKLCACSISVINPRKRLDCAAPSPDAASAGALLRAHARIAFERARTRALHRIFGDERNIFSAGYREIEAGGIDIAKAQRHLIDHLGKRSVIAAVRVFDRHRDVRGIARKVQRVPNRFGKDFFRELYLLRSPGHSVLHAHRGPGRDRSAARRQRSVWRIRKVLRARRIAPWVPVSRNSNWARRRRAPYFPRDRDAAARR